jgi:branched-chain amino acid transport system substrate-binding protein
MRRSSIVTSGLLALSLLALASCSVDEGTGDAAAETVTVGIIGSYTGPISHFGPAWEEGFRAGLDVATNGTNQVGNVKVEIEVRNDNSDPTTGLAVATELLGEGIRIIAGPASSAVVVPVAQLAMENDAIFIAGNTGTAEIDGMGAGVYRTAPTTPQLNTAVMAAAEASGADTLMYLGQDYAYGQGALASLKEIGPSKGIEVSGILLPTTTRDFTTAVAEALASDPDAIFVGWAGEGQPQLFQALTDQGGFDTAHVITIGPGRPQFDSYAAALGEVNLEKAELITYYGEDTMGNAAEAAMNEALQRLGLDAPIDIQQAAGYFAALMVVKAIEEVGAGLDVQAVHQALTSASFETPVGAVTIRAEDHVPVQPIFGYAMEKVDGEYRLKLIKTHAAEDVLSPVTRTIT